MSRGMFSVIAAALVVCVVFGVYMLLLMVRGSQRAPVNFDRGPV